MRGEPLVVTAVRVKILISTHSPRAGRTSVTRTNGYYYTQFQLTRPVRGEPCQKSARQTRCFHFNSLAPCGANPTATATATATQRFQLTRPVRGEPISEPFIPDERIFQLTRPVRGEP